MQNPTSVAAEPGRRNRNMLRLAFIGAAVAIVLGATFVAASFYTDQPDFCRSCHEMRPYYDAWASGSHKDRWCVDCHTTGEYAGRMGHKFVALREVAVHFLGDPTFPLTATPTVPDSRCKSCHSRIVTKKASGFSHEQHAEKGTCQACHAATGHDVSREALAAAGVLGRQMPSPSIATTFVAVGYGRANVAGHVGVTCTKCHDMRNTGCNRCHSLPAGKKHPRSSACNQCHSAGPKWTFAHPAGKLECQTCHSAPAKHYAAAIRRVDQCSTCHRNPGSSWRFAHPGSSAQCTSCHQAPSRHYGGQCSSCHRRTGASFAFRHPSVGEEHSYRQMGCAKCHPNGYAKASCTCHDQGKVEDDD